jgi:endoglucanase
MNKKCKNNNYIIMLIFVIFSTLFLGGCGLNSPVQAELTTETHEHQFESLFNEAEINYVVPVSVPNIKVNQLGYLTNSVKMAVFRGDNLPDNFSVINAETGKTVYTGEIENRGFNEITDEHLSYGTFTALTAPGTYYIEAQVVGRSYFFAIGDNLYDEVFTLASRQYYLNRCGITLTEEYAGKFARSACHIAKVPLREDASVSLDVTGGWHQDSTGSKEIGRASCRDRVVQPV